MSEKVLEFSKPLKTYQYEFHCNNCHTTKKMNIPFGVLVAEYNPVCEHCGTTPLQFTEFFHNGGLAAKVAKPKNDV